MERLNINDLRRQEEYLSLDKESGTAIDGLYFNPANNRIGFLKQNGCMLDIDHEDIREKLASDILELIELPRADIELCIDGDKHCCLSYSVLKENEKHIDMSKYEEKIIINNYEEYETERKKMKKEDLFKESMNEYLGNLFKLKDITNEQKYYIKQRIMAIILMDCIMDHYDRKSENMKIIYNPSTNKYYPPITYDYGTAFNESSRQKNGVFRDLSNEDVMYFLFNNNYSDIEDMVEKIEKTLNIKNLNNIFEQSYLNVFDNKEFIKNQILERINQLKYYHSKKINDINKKKRNQILKRTLGFIKSSLGQEEKDEVKKDSINL